MSGIPNIPSPRNEPILSYAPGSPERATLKAELARLSGEVADIPAIVGGKEIRSGDMFDVTSPHKHRHVIARAHLATADTVRAAAKSAIASQREWARLQFEDRAAVFLRAADMLATTHRALLNAATMLGQSKTAFQAEIDSACELIDFFRFNVALRRAALPRAAGVVARRVEPDGSPSARRVRLRGHAIQLHGDRRQPAGRAGAHGQHRGVEAVARGAAQQLLRLPAARDGRAAAGRDQLRAWRAGDVHGDAGGGAVLRRHPLHRVDGGVPAALATRSASRLDKYVSYPRIVGETGGKDFVVAHPSADADALAVALVRGAYEYQGQKCSAASRAYIPDTLWPAVRDRVVAMIADIRMGDVADFRNFMGAVIDRKAFDPHPGLPRGGEDGAGRQGRRGRRMRRQGGLVHPADPAPGRRPEVPHHVRGDLRSGADGARVPGGASGARRSSW